MCELDEIKTLKSTCMNVFNYTLFTGSFNSRFNIHKNVHVVPLK